MKNENEGWIIIAWGLAIGLGLVGLGLCLKFVLPALGAMVGIATTIIGGGIVSMKWVVPVASVGLAATGTATGVILLVKVVKEAKKKPFEWALPILAIVSGLVIDTCKELYQTDNSFIRIIYGASVSGLFLLAGILWTQNIIKIKWLDKLVKVKSFSTKIVSGILFLTPPFLIYLRYCQTANKKLIEGFNDIPSHIFFAIILLIVFLILVTILSWIFKDDD